MLRIAIYLDRPVRIALDQQRKRAGSKREGRCKVVWLAEDEVLWRLDVGIDRLIGLLGAAGETGHGQGGAHQLHEAAARDRIDPFAGVRGKLLLHAAVKTGTRCRVIEPLPACSSIELGARRFQRHSPPRIGSCP